jgi:hypothetical protein
MISCFSLCLQGNDTTATTTIFVFLGVAIHQAWCTDHDDLRFTDFISKISADIKP